MTDPFGNSSASAPADDPFGPPATDDPFTPPKDTGGTFGPAPRFADLGGRLLALRLQSIEERQKYKAPEGVMESTGIVDIGVLDGGMIYAPPAKDENGKIPFGAPRQECGDAPQLFKGRFVSARGILNKFPAVRKIKEGEGKDAREKFIIGSGATVILGRLGKLVTDADYAKHLGVNLTKPTEDDLAKVKAWLDTKPEDDDVKRAGAFWTVVKPSDEAWAMAVEWSRATPAFME